MAQQRKHVQAGRPRNPKQAGSRRVLLDDLLEPALFKALGDPVRARLLSCVARCGRACSVGEAALSCELELSTVSRHLAQLARAGVMETVKRGTSVLYSVRHEQVVARLRALADELAACAPKAECDVEFPKDACCGD